MALLSQILAVESEIKVGFWSTFLSDLTDFFAEIFQNPKIIDQMPTFENKLDRKNIDKKRVGGTFYKHLHRGKISKQKGSAISANP